MKLSIITINYNNRKGFEKTAKSIASQTCQDFEWIVIDGGSIDGSVDVIKRYASLISHWVSEPDKGIYHAMNKGVSFASGDYFQFLNSGDCLYDKDVVKAFCESGLCGDVIYGRAMIVDSHDSPQKEWKLPVGELRLSFFWSHNLNHQATFFSKRCFGIFKYNENHTINSDQELMMTLAYNGYKFKFFNRIVVNYDNGGISSAENDSRKRNDEFIDTINNLLPSPIMRDYADLIQLRDVDILQKALDLVNSNHIVRTITRIFIYPLHYLLARKR